jgi:hypothetical protein
MIKKKFLKNRSGAATIELIIVIPVFLFLLFGVIEVGRLILVNQKVGRAAFSVANTLSSATSTNITDQIRNSFTSAERLVAPFRLDTSRNSGIIITAFNRNGSGSTQRVFQCKSQSRLNSQVSSLNGIITLDPNEGVYVIEIFLDYDTILTPNFYTSYLGNKQRVIAARQIIRPREGGTISTSVSCP